MKNSYSGVPVPSNGKATLEDFSDAQRRPYCAAYVSSDMGGLRGIIDQYIFSLIYPNALVRGIAELTESVLSSQFPSWQIARETLRDAHRGDGVESLNVLGNIYCAQRQFTRAEEYYNKALALRPDYAASRQNLAELAKHREAAMISR